MRRNDRLVLQAVRSLGDRAYGRAIQERTGLPFGVLYAAVVALEACGRVRTFTGDRLAARDGRPALLVRLAA